MNIRIPIKSKLTQKIITRFLMVQISFFVVIFIMLFSILFSSTKNSSIIKCDYIAESITLQVDYQLTHLASLIDTITASSSVKQGFSDYISSDNSSMEYSKLNILLNNYASGNSYADHISITLEDGTRFFSITNFSSKDEEIYSDSNYIELLNSESSSWTSPIYNQQKTDGTTLSTIAYSKRVTISNISMVITIFSDVTTLLSNTDQLMTGYYDDIAIFDIYGNLLYETNNTYSFPFADDDLNFYNYYSDLTNNNNGYYSITTGSNSFCSIVGFTSTSLLYQDFYVYALYTLVLFLLIFISTIIIITPMIAKQLLPLSSLYDSMKSISEGQKTYSNIETDDEIGALSSIYNKMLDTIDQNTQALIEKEQEQNVMRFSLIISQIDPHFIFNTMNIITSLARQNKTDDIIKINTSLIKLLQDRLRISSTEVYDSISHEIEITKEYISIVQYRAQINVDIRWICSDDLKDFQIPKNILQPIIENSLIHGLYNPETSEIEGKLIIEFIKSKYDILINIVDNGKGITAQALDDFYNRDYVPDKEKRGQHIGLKNIQQRLSYIYKNDNLMNIRNISPHGTIVSIKLMLDLPSEDSI